MTSIKELKKVLSEIEKAPITAGPGQLEEIMQRAGAHIPGAGMDNFRDKCIKSLHDTIQTEMMIQSCISAKRSCFWASVAAIAACLSVVLVLFLRVKTVN